MAPEQSSPDAQARLLYKLPSDFDYAADPTASSFEGRAVGVVSLDEDGAVKDWSCSETVEAPSRWSPANTFCSKMDYTAQNASFGAGSSNASSSAISRKSSAQTSAASNDTSITAPQTHRGNVVVPIVSKDTTVKVQATIQTVHSGSRVKATVAGLPVAAKLTADQRLVAIGRGGEVATPLPHSKAKPSGAHKLVVH